MLLVSGSRRQGMLHELSNFMFAVFDTDDVTMEVVTGKTLFSAMQSGVVIENASINNQYFYIIAEGNIPYSVYRSKYLTVLNIEYECFDILYKGKLFSFRVTSRTRSIRLNDRVVMFQCSDGVLMHAGKMNMFGLVVKDEKPSDFIYFQFDNLNCLLDMSKGIVYQISCDRYFSELVYKDNHIVWAGKGLPIDEHSYVRKYMLTGTV